MNSSERRAPARTAVEGRARSPRPRARAHTARDPRSEPRASASWWGRRSCNDARTLRRFGG
eukprot:4459777-Prymnesium_polylepis.1